MISLSLLIGVLFLYFVLIEVLKQSKTLTFLFLLCLFFPKLLLLLLFIYFLTTKGGVGNGDQMELNTSGQSVKF